MLFIYPKWIPTKLYHFRKLHLKSVLVFEGERWWFETHPSRSHFNRRRWQPSLFRKLWEFNFCDFDRKQLLVLKWESLPSALFKVRPTWMSFKSLTFAFKYWSKICGGDTMMFTMNKWITPWNSIHWDEMIFTDHSTDYMKFILYIVCSNFPDQNQWILIRYMI